MNDTLSITFADLERLEEAEAPNLVEAIHRFAGCGGDDDDDDDDDGYDDDGQPKPKAAEEPLPPGVMSFPVLRELLLAASKKRRRAERGEAAREAWGRYFAQDEKYQAKPLALADFLVSLYEKDTPFARHTLLTIAEKGEFPFGIWGGMKRIYKRAEAGLDATMWAAIAVAIETSFQSDDVKRGTVVYMVRRGKRFLRLLGKALPELYPQFAVEILRRYPPRTRTHGMTAGRYVLAHDAKKWGASKPDKGKKWAPTYLEAWKRGPEPLMLLLETCQCDTAADFAIRLLKDLFPEALRKVTPDWLGRLAFRPLESAHEFLVETLEASPDFHQGKLDALGLKAAVLRLLVSPSQKARKYAVEYARAHASDLPNEELVDLVVDGEKEPRDFAFALLQSRGARKVGPALLSKLLPSDVARKWAAAALDSEFEKKELPEALLVDLLLSDESEQNGWAEKYLAKKYGKTELPITFWTGVTDDPRFPDSSATDFVAGQISAYPAAGFPSDWFLKAMTRDDLGSVLEAWLKRADALPVGVDIERLKGFVFDPRARGTALAILGNTKLVAPRDLGLGWLLALARRADPRLHEWAHKYLIQYMRPEHFAESGGSAEAGTARLFALATGAKEPEAVRLFAQNYLRCHHPKLSRDQADAKAYGIKPLLARAAFTMERVWSSLFDVRGDVRRFAVDVARVELRRWGAASSVYELGESAAKEVRNIAFDALMQAGEATADPNLALTLDELDAAQIFSMTESRRRATRDVAMELIRKHYARIGGATRLGWLMQSADREVRLFAVKLLWEKHRPRGLPSGWKPAKEGARIEDGGAFEDQDALRSLLRRLLFTLPGTRSNEPLGDKRAKKLAASVAKRLVIEIVRDLGLEDRAFAEHVAPVLEEFTGSLGKTEWQACLSALLTLRSAHGLVVAGVT